MTQTQSIESGINSRMIVLSFVNALTDEDFKAARDYASDDMTFTGVLGTRDNADEYFGDMEKMKLKYRVEKVFVEAEDVCLLYNVTMSGITVFCCGWYHVEGEKIKSIRVIFDPRPVLEAGANSQKND